ncbi:MAG TPA: 1-deoxy-D-xylulose-5-phosphate reductoisomerase [Candidatus Acidoferrales bacterium]|nr:1-deoxy-D-xylulose-5-phosphate reductoisomerase [Candidatus Acidoferrales bacterium]
MKSISILGSTGSIGRQCLDVVGRHPDRFRVVALAAGSSMETLAEQVRTFRPELVSVGDASRVAELKSRLGSRNGRGPEILTGAAGLEAVATHPGAEIVLSAAVGVVGLPATYAAIQRGKTVALANKEVLVAAGEVVMAAARKAGVTLLPVDSEHNAIHQCLRAGGPKEVRRLVLTASGGPFRTTPLSRLARVTPKQALAHPNWRMGQRITIDSATLMNKGFEVIEAGWLFDMPLERIDVVIHPQSIIHSMVEYVDGSVLAQLGPPDMRLPIQYALTWPERMPAAGFSLDWSRIERLEFAAPSARKFPCLALAREAMRRGGAAPCALNAADEMAVAAFLAGRIAFPGIARVVERVLEGTAGGALGSIEQVLAADRDARRRAEELVSAEGVRRKGR